MTNQFLCQETKNEQKMTNQLFCWEMTKNDQAMYLPRNEKWPKMTRQLLYLVVFFLFPVHCSNDLIDSSLHFLQVHMLFLLHLLWKNPSKFISYHIQIFIILCPQAQHHLFLIMKAIPDTCLHLLILYYKFQCLIASLWLQLSHFIIKCKQCQMCILYSAKIYSQIM